MALFSNSSLTERRFSSFCGSKLVNYIILGNILAGIVFNAELCQARQMLLNHRRAQIVFDDLEFREGTLCQRNGYGDRQNYAECYKDITKYIN